MSKLTVQKLMERVEELESDKRILRLALAMSAEYRNAQARKYANKEMFDAKEHALNLIAILDGGESP